MMDTQPTQSTGSQDPLHTSLGVPVHIICDNCVTLTEYRVSIYVLMVVLLWIAAHKYCR